MDYFSVWIVSPSKTHFKTIQSSVNTNSYFFLAHGEKFLLEKKHKQTHVVHIQNSGNMCAACLILSSLQVRKGEWPEPRMVGHSELPESSLSSLLCWEHGKVGNMMDSESESSNQWLLGRGARQKSWEMLMVFQSIFMWPILTRIPCLTFVAIKNHLQSSPYVSLRLSTLHLGSQSLLGPGIFSGNPTQSSVTEP